MLRSVLERRNSSMPPVVAKYLATAGKSFAEAVIGIVIPGLVAIGAAEIQKAAAKQKAAKEKEEEK